MRQIVRQFYKILLVPLLGVILLFPVQTAAAEGYSCDITIPVEVTVTGNDIPSGNEYEVFLEPTQDGLPMPDAASAVITDKGKAAIGPIRYTAPGDYKYRLYLKAAQKENFTYDHTVYTLTVRVTNKKGGGLEAIFWVNKEEAGKSADILFTNSYVKPSVPGGEPEEPGTPQEPQEPEDNPVRSILTGVLGARVNPPLIEIPQAGVLGQRRGAQTGDDTQMMVWILLAISAAAAGGLVLARKKKR